MRFTYAKILESCILALPSNDMDETMLISLQALDDSMHEAGARISTLERTIEDMDCRYVGRLAEMSGSHCPTAKPCSRFRHESTVDTLKGCFQMMVTQRDVAESERDSALARVEVLEAGSENMRQHGYRQQRSRLMPYIMHKHGCGLEALGECDCGLDSALNETD